MEILGLNDSRLVTPETKAKEGAKAPSQDRPMYKTEGSGAEVYTGISEGIRIQVGAPLAEIQRVYVEQTLRRYGGDKEKAARALNLDKETLAGKIKRYGL